MRDARDISKDIPDSEWMVCAKCGRVLEKLDEFSGGYERLEKYTWQHPFDVTHAEGGEDHPPEPVMRKDAPIINEKCDFCLADDPNWILPTDNFQEPFGMEDLIQISDSDWCACDACADLIRRSYWDRLTNRALKAYRDRTGRPMDAVTEGLMRSLYRQVSRHVKGPIQPRGDRRT